MSSFSPIQMRMGYRSKHVPGSFAGMRMNKPLYTISYTFATAGAAGFFFAGIYTLVSSSELLCLSPSLNLGSKWITRKDTLQVDMYGFRKPTIPMEWLGKHALMIYVLVACNILPMFIHGFYWKEPKNNLVSWRPCHMLLLAADFSGHYCK